MKDEECNIGDDDIDNDNNPGEDPNELVEEYLPIGLILYEVFSANKDNVPILIQNHEGLGKTFGFIQSVEEEDTVNNINQQQSVTQKQMNMDIGVGGNANELGIDVDLEMGTIYQFKKDSEIKQPSIISSNNNNNNNTNSNSNSNSNSNNNSNNNKIDQLAKILMIGVINECKRSAIGTLLFKKSISLIETDFPKCILIYTEKDERQISSEPKQVINFLLKNYFQIINKEKNNLEANEHSLFFYPLDLMARDLEQRSYYNLFKDLVRVVCKNLLSSCRNQNYNKMKKQLKNLKSYYEIEFAYEQKKKKKKLKKSEGNKFELVIDNKGKQDLPFEIADYRMSIITNNQIGFFYSKEASAKDSNVIGKLSQNNDKRSVNNCNANDNIDKSNNNNENFDKRNDEKV